MSNTVLIDMISELDAQFHNQLPTQDKISNWIEECRMIDEHAILKKLMKIEEVRLLLPAFGDAADGMSEAEVRETLLSFVEINYPQIIQMLLENEEDGQKMMGTLKLITAEICNAST